MPKFRKKPVEIEAWRFLGGGPFPDWLAEGVYAGKLWYQGGSEPYMTIETLEGERRANVGDWIIKGVKGEFYPCKPDIFEATYDVV